jgi:hypothetical protein
MSVDSTPQILLLVAHLFEKRVEDASKIRVDDTMTYIIGFFMPHQSANILLKEQVRMKSEHKRVGSKQW